MDIGVAHEPKATVVKVTGEIDIHTAHELETAMVGATGDVGEHARNLVLDLTDVTFLDSTALGVLVGVDKQLRKTGGAFKLVCPDQRLLKIFKISHLDTIWPVFATVADAT